jgi:hypothetical protein
VIHDDIHSFSLAFLCFISLGFRVVEQGQITIFHPRRRHLQRCHIKADRLLFIGTPTLPLPTTHQFDHTKVSTTTNPNRISANQSISNHGVYFFVQLMFLAAKKFCKCFRHSLSKPRLVSTANKRHDDGWKRLCN